jgi:hypothetical protein
LKNLTFNINRNQSKLSCQPILSTRNLISRLSCKSELDEFESNSKTKISYAESSDLLTTNYKETFQLDESQKEKLSLSSSSSTASIQSYVTKIIVDPINTNKILNKRPNIDKLRLDQQDFDLLKDTNPTNSNETYKSTSYTDQIESTDNQFDLSENYMHEILSDGVFKENLPKFKLPFKSYNPVCKLLNRPKNKINYFAPKYGNAFKIRRIFDGETLRINQIKLNTPDDLRLNHVKQMDRNLKQKQQAYLTKNMADQQTDTGEIDFKPAIVESTMISTTTKTSSLINNFNNNIKKNYSGIFNSSRNRTPQNINERKIKSANSKVRFDVNLLQQSAKSLSSDKTIENQKSIEGFSFSNLASEESILESKLIEIQSESSLKKLSEENINNKQKEEEEEEVALNETPSNDVKYVAESLSSEYSSEVNENTGFKIVISNRESDIPQKSEFITIDENVPLVEVNNETVCNQETTTLDIFLHENLKNESVLTLDSLADEVAKNGNFLFNILI